MASSLLATVKDGLLRGFPQGTNGRLGALLPRPPKMTNSTTTTKKMPAESTMMTTTQESSKDMLRVAVVDNTSTKRTRSVHSFELPVSKSPSSVTAMEVEETRTPDVREEKRMAAPVMEVAAKEKQAVEAVQVVQKVQHRELMEIISLVILQLQHLPAASQSGVAQETELGMRPSTTTSFYCPDRIRPTISLDQYLLRLVKGINRVHRDARAPHESIGCQAMLVGLAYAKRLMSTNAFLLDDLNVHRVVATSILVAVKFLEDDVIGNDSYARLAGVPLAEINRLELALCNALSWKFFLSAEEFEAILSLCK